jgi:hypothetical protein
VCGFGVNSGLLHICFNQVQTVASIVPSGDIAGSEDGLDGLLMMSLLEMAGLSVCGECSGMSSCTRSRC